jgi:hypothetical protein
MWCISDAFVIFMWCISDAFVIFMQGMVCANEKTI